MRHRGDGFPRRAVYTLDTDQPWGSAVAVRGNRIVAVGTDDEATAAAGPDARIVELDGRMVQPGFVEGHIQGFGSRVIRPRTGRVGCPPIRRR